MKAELIGAMTETGMCDPDKVVGIVDSLFTKLRDIVVPFVGSAIFKWIDRDASKGITKVRGPLHVVSPSAAVASERRVAVL